MFKKVVAQLGISCGWRDFWKKRKIEQKRLKEKRRELQNVFKMKSSKAKVECERRRAFSNRLIEIRQLISPFFVLFGVLVYSLLFPGGFELEFFFFLYLSIGLHQSITVPEIFTYQARKGKDQDRRNLKDFYIQHDWF